MSAIRSSSARAPDPQKRLAILEAAQRVFLKDGFSGASMDHVAAEAGVGKMTVYRHFGSKESLFEAMLREVCAGMFPNTALPRAETLREELTGLAGAFLDLVTEPRRVATYRLALAEAERFPEFARLFYEGAVLVVLDHVTGRLAAHAPDVPGPEVRTLAGMFLQMVQGPAMLRLMLGIGEGTTRADFHAQIGMAVDFVETRLRRPPEPAAAGGA